MSFKGSFSSPNCLSTFVLQFLSFKMVNTWSDRAKNIDVDVEKFQKELVEKVMVGFDRSVEKVMARFD